MRSAKTNHVLNLVSDVSLVPRAAAGGAGAGLPDCAAVAQEREEEEAEPRLVNRLRPAQDLPAGEIQVRFESITTCENGHERVCRLQKWEGPNGQPSRAGNSTTEGFETANANQGHISPLYPPSTQLSYRYIR